MPWNYPLVSHLNFLGIHSPKDSWEYPKIQVTCGIFHGIPLENVAQYNTIQYNTTEQNTIQFNTIQYNTIQYSTI